MKRLIRIELRRAFTSPSFWLALLIGIIIVTIHYFQNVVTCVQFLDDYKTAKILGIYPHSVFNKWIGGEASSFQPYLYFLLIPILATIPFGGSFYEDNKSGFIKNIFVKTNKKHYYFSKYISVFLSAGVVIVMPLLVNLALTAATLPSLIPQIGTQTFPLFATSMWSTLYYSNPYVYLILYLILIFVFGGFLSTIALSISHFVKNRLIVILSPFIICLFVHSVCGLIEANSFDPLTFLNPAQANSSIIIVLIELMLISIITVSLFIVKGIKDDTF